MTFTWIYGSTNRIDAEERNSIVDKMVSDAVSRNQSLNVTGALLFTGSRFAQYLEGDPAAVTALMDSIKRDARHSDVFTIFEGHSDHRRFVNWSLAYAGPSVFIAHTIDKAIAEAVTSSRKEIRRLVQIMAEFAVGGSA